jgi:HSP20 family molecular chaperone IbpA
VNRFNNKTTIVGLITLITGIVLGLGIAVWSTGSSRANSAPTGSRARAHSAVTADLPDSTTAPHDEWDPFRRLERMQEEIDRAIRHATEQFQIGSGAPGFLPDAGYSSSFHLRDQKDHFELRAYLPDAQASDVKVRLDDRQTLRVSVSQHKQEVRKDGGSEARVTELGQYEQVVTLPGPVKGSDMKVKRNGHEVIIRIPKVKST